MIVLSSSEMSRQSILSTTKTIKSLILNVNQQHPSSVLFCPAHTAHMVLWDTVYTVAAVNNTQKMTYYISLKIINFVFPLKIYKLNLKSATRRAPLLKPTFISIQPEQDDGDGRRFILGPQPLNQEKYLHKRPVPIRLFVLLNTAATSSSYTKINPWCTVIRTTLRCIFFSQNKYLPASRISTGV